MAMRPIYRWKSFWLGVFVACFFGWAWWDSQGIETRAQRMTASGSQGVVRVDGVTFVFNGARHFLAFDGVMRLPAEKSAREVEEDDFELWGNSYVKIPDGAVWACFAVPWAAWLAWRWRRMRRVGVGWGAWQWMRREVDVS